MDSEPQIVAGDTSDFSMTLQGNEPNAVSLDVNSQRLVFNSGMKGLATGSGFKPGTKAEVWLFSEPRFLGYADVKPDGTFELEFVVPLDIEFGSHTIQAEGVTRLDTFRAVSTGVAIREVSLPITGFNVNMWPGVLLLLFGLTLILCRRIIRYM